MKISKLVWIVECESSFRPGTTWTNVFKTRKSALESIKMCKEIDVKTLGPYKYILENNI